MSVACERPAPVALAALYPRRPACRILPASAVVPPVFPLKAGREGSRARGLARSATDGAARPRRGWIRNEPALHPGRSAPIGGRCGCQQGGERQRGSDGNRRCVVARSVASPVVVACTASNGGPAPATPSVRRALVFLEGSRRDRARGSAVAFEAGRPEATVTSLPSDRSADRSGRTRGGGCQPTSRPRRSLPRPSLPHATTARATYRKRATSNHRAQRVAPPR